MRSTIEPRSVYIDTTELKDRYLLVGKDWEDLLERAQREQVKLLLPDVVLQEGERQYAEELDKAIPATAKHVRTLRALGYETDVPDLLAQRDELAASYRATVEKRLRAARGDVLPLPDPSHQSLLDRVKLRRKPFHSSGKGYQDALIWLSILEHMRANAAEMAANPPALVTNNHSDFCEESGKLHADLLEDVHQISPSLDVEHFASLRDLLTDLRERFKAADQAHRYAGLFSVDEREAFASFADEARELDAAITRAVEGCAAELVGRRVVNWQELASRDSALQVASLLPDGLSEATITDVGLVPNSLDSQPHDWFDGDTVALSATVEAEVSLEGFMTKADYYVLDDDSISVNDADWNDHYMEVGLDRAIQLSFNLLVIGCAVESIEFEGAEVV